MNDQLMEKLSAFMDGEVDDQRVIESLRQHDEARSSWMSYHLIRDVMNHHYVAGSQQLAARVSAAIEDEPTVLAPKRWYKPRKILRHASGAAIAATIAAVAILVVRQSPEVPQDIPHFAVGPITTQPVRLTTEAENKLNSYIVSHNEYSASARFKGMLPYTRIISYTQGQGYARPSIADVKK
ncbi:MAG: sigma-E factor negative regulatory protein [Gammaproteobacteria bacterium]|jgi:sigma-E factor negative regulatory protein RseA